MTGKGPKPGPDAAYAAMIQLAENSRFDRNIPHRGVIDAMLRQPHDATARPWQVHRLGAGPLTIRAADYDLGPAGVAYADTVDASYRSEEHTSELQSLMRISYAVFCLKKKKRI